MEDEAIDAVFEELGKAARYFPAGGVSTTVLVRRAAVPTETEFGTLGRFSLSPGRQAGACAIQVRASEVAEPATGDRVELADGRRYDVTDTPRHNGHGVWHLTLCEVAP